MTKKIHFYHLATVDGLLCVHTGIVGEEENLEVTLDEYAPFTYDKLKKEIENDGYGSQCDIEFAIKINGWNNDNRWSKVLAEFEIELLWNGLGTSSGGSSSDEERKSWYYVVDEDLAMKLLLGLGEKYKAKEKIEVYSGYTMFDELKENDIYKNRKLIFKQ